MGTSLLLFSVVVFLAVVLALEGLYNVVVSKRGSEAKRIAARLAAMRGEAHAEVRLERDAVRDRMPWFQAALDRFPAGRRLTQSVRAAAVTSTPGELILVSAALALVGLLLPRMLGKPPVFGLVLALGLAALPWWRVAQKRNQRIARFEYQFPEALDLMGRAMRAGHAFPTALKMAGEELSDPLGREFRILFDEMNYGVPAGEALSHLADRVPLADVGYFVVAVMIQRESGGNLAELLDKISAIVRERIKLFGEVRTLSAEGRLSAIILVCLPIGVGLVVNLMSPGFMSVLWTDPLGQKVTGISLFMMLVGIIWMRSVIRIRI
ncbi:MAG: type II secretion system F family protein [Rhizobacter sp.]